jgi:membrane-associated phospholipid phosphatase
LKNDIFAPLSSSIEKTYPKGGRGCNLVHLNILIINYLSFDTLFSLNYLLKLKPTKFIVSMSEFYNKNEPFFFISYLFLMFGIAWQLFLPQTYPFFFFSEHRTFLGDWFFKITTWLGETAPYIAFTAYFFVKDKKKILLSVMTGFAALLVSTLLKMAFAHDRPATVLSKTGLLAKVKFVEGVEIFQGTTSFPSGHTMSAFAIYGLAAFLFENTTLKAIFALIAVLIGVSRVYLIEHFPEDVLVGAMIGLMIGITVYHYRAVIEDFTA